MAPRPTVIGTQGYRRGLASLSVVKERLFRVHRNVPVGRFRPHFILDRIAITPNQLARGFVWWDLQDHIRLSGLVITTLKPGAISPSSSAYLSFR